MCCTRCGLGIPDDVHVCWACGAQQPSDHLCVHCGITLPPDAPACLACGAVQSPKTWEYCEIRVEHGTKDTDAIGILAGSLPIPTNSDSGLMEPVPPASTLWDTVTGPRALSLQSGTGICSSV